MKKLLMLVFLIIVLIGLIVPELSFTGEQNTITTLFLVRHAEKAASVWEDPGLTPAGTARADELAYMLKHVKLDAIYSTPFKRTKLTVLPIAKQKGLGVKPYKPNEADFLQKVLQAFPGGTVLIVGHSNTIPKLANELSGQFDFSDLDDPIYDNLFIACVPNKGNAVILRMRFGSHTPEK
ncbi:MAG: histidine phosphatase family protein [Candidatus Aminicenantes bacterium]|nr:MAG: histidine phosphatase family protein [Candidatus Aminicenantes bacterium]